MSLQNNVHFSSSKSILQTLCSATSHSPAKSDQWQANLLTHWKHSTLKLFHYFRSTLLIFDNILPRYFQAAEHWALLQPGCIRIPTAYWLLPRACYRRTGWAEQSGPELQEPWRSAICNCSRTRNGRFSWDSESTGKTCQDGCKARREIIIAALPAETNIHTCMAENTQIYR